MDYPIDLLYRSYIYVITMDNIKKRVILFVFGFASMVAVFSFIYMIGMSVFEGEEIKYYVAVQKTVESVTTAGFGGHAPWSSLGMNVIIVVMNLVGVSLFFFGVPIALAPLIAPSIKQAIRDRPPRESDKKDHVIITEYDDTDEVLVEKLNEYGYDYLLIIEDEDRALELQREGHDVIFGSPEDTDVLKNANIEKSRSLIVDIEDSVNPSILLSGKRYGEETDKISVVRSKDVERYHELSGADFVLKSRTEFGRALGLRSILNLRKEINNIINHSPNTKEVVINPDDEIAGYSVREYSERVGESILCGWFNGQFIPAPRPDKTVSENAILITTDNESSEDTKEDRDYVNNGGNKVVIAGYGNVGRSVKQTVESRGHDTITIDNKREDADIIGDISDPETLREANISDADSIVITINNDVKIIYSTLVASNLSPETDIISRVNKEENIWKVYDSGADFVISLETLTGNVIANRIIEDRDFISTAQELEVNSISGEKYAGMNMEDTDIVQDEGYIIAMEKRNGELIGDIDGKTKIEEDDTLIYIQR